MLLYLSILAPLANARKYSKLGNLVSISLQVNPPEFDFRYSCPPTLMQSLLCARNGEGGTSTLDSSHDVPLGPVDTKGGGGGGGALHGSFSEVEECLWLRVFSAVGRYAIPCRTEPRQGPTPPDLVPLGKAVASIEEIFGGEREPAATSLPKRRTSTGR